MSTGAHRRSALFTQAPVVASEWALRAVPCPDEQLEQASEDHRPTLGLPPAKWSKLSGFPADIPTYCRKSYVPAAVIVRPHSAVVKQNPGTGMRDVRNVEEKHVQA